MSSAITASGFTLKWTASTDNVKVIGYDVLKDGTLFGTSTTSTLAISGLAPAALYSMTVQARDAAGNVSAPSAALGVTTIKATSVAPTITSPSAVVYGNGYTATATGSAGTGALVWALGTGSTAANAAIDSATGEVTASSSGRAVIKVQRAGDAMYNPSPFSANFTVTIAVRPITLTLSGSKIYDGTTVATGASTAITAGSLAPGDTIAYVYAATSSAKAGTYLKLETPTISNALAPLVRNASYAITYTGSYAITKGTQLAPTVTSASGVVYGTAYTATATGGSGTGALIWALGAGTTASGVAINPATGAVTAKSAGLVVINVQRAADANYDLSPASDDFTITVTPRPITVTLAGAKIYNGTTVATGATATRTLGTLASGDVLGSVFAPTDAADVGVYTGLATSTVTNAAAPADRTGSYAITYTGSYAINQATQLTPVISSGNAAVYGTPYNATVTGGLGTGALTWSLGTGSTAPGAAVDATTGSVTTNGSGKVYIRVQRAADINYKLSPQSANYLVTFATRQITVTLGGFRPYNGTKVATGATATITVGDLVAGDTIASVFANTSSAAIGTYSGLTTSTVSNVSAPSLRTTSYAITYNGTYSIGNIPTTFALDHTSFTYTGGPLGPTVSATPGAATFNTGGTLSATAVGTYTATATATGSYTGSDNALTWTIALAGPPSSPSNVTSSNVTANGFTLNWDSGGAGVTEYEVFVNGVSQGTTTQTTMTISGLNPGTSYIVTVRAHGAGGWSDPSPPVTVLFTGVPFIANFEPDEGYHVGPLDGQNGWTVTGMANIVTTPVYAGAQALSIPPATVASFSMRTFSGSTPAVTFIDLYALPAAAATPDAGVFLETDVMEVALTGTGSTGAIQVFNGDGAGGGSWVSTGVGPALDGSGQSATWNRYTVRADYTSRKWDLFFNGQMIQADLGFINNASTSLAALSLGGHTTATTGFDELFVSFDNPLFVDADHDGMDDAWEIAHGLNPMVNDRDLDPDGDGLTNIQEYVLGTDPQVPNHSNTDTDGDGLADAWEMQYFGTLSFGPADDPGGVGRTLAQSYAQGLSPWPPAAVTVGLRAWYRADLGVAMDSNRKVIQWRDVSGVGNHALESDPSVAPTWTDNVFNAHPAIRFTGLTPVKLPDVMNGASQGEIFIVTRLKDYSLAHNAVAHFGGSTGTFYGNGQFWNDFGGGDGQPVTLADPSLLLSPHLFDASMSGGTGVVQINGVEISRKPNNGTYFRANPLLGADWQSEGYNGDIAEVLVYDRALSASESALVAGYLTAKYGLGTHAPVPVITSGLTASATVNTALVPAYTITATDSPTSYSATGLPAGLAVDTTTGVISGTPTAVGTTSVTISATNAGGSGSATLVITVNPPVTHPPTTGMRLWLKADAGVVLNGMGTVDHWVDQSSAHNDAALAGVSPVLVGNAMNGQPAIRFSDYSVFNLPDVMNGASGGEIVIVTRLKDFSRPVSGLAHFGGNRGTNYGPAGVWNDFGGGDGNLITLSDPSVLLAPHVFDASMSGGTGVVSINGVVISTKPNTGTYFRPNPTLGDNWQNEPYNGDIAEVLVYDHLLSDPDRVSVNAYLAFKYALGGGTGVPAITSALTSSATVGSPLSYAITASNSPTSYDATGLPAGLAVNTATGAIAGTPTAVGATNVTLSATNAAGTGSATLVITVTPASGDTQPPSAPTTLASSNVSTTGLTLSWTASTDNVGVTGYTIYASGVAIGTSATTSFSATSLTPGTPYHLTVKAEDAAGNFSAASAVLDVSTVADGSSVPTGGMRLWLRADLGLTLDGNGKVTTWLDQSGLNRNAYQSVDTTRPLLVANAINGHPVLRFDGVDDWMEVLEFMHGATEGELFIIAKVPNFATREDGLWGLGGADGTNTEGSPKVLTDDFGRNYRTSVGVPLVPLSDYFVYNVSATTGDWTVRLNGQMQDHRTDNIVRFGPNGWLGRAGGRYLQGDIAEVVAYDHVLTANDRSAVNGYLASKYAITHSSAPVITSPLTVSATVNSPLSPVYTITATQSPTAFNATGLPAGLSIDPATGVISGAPTAVGTSNISLSASNGTDTGYATLVLTVDPVATTFSLSSTALSYTGAAQGPTVIANPSGANFTTGGTLRATAVGTYTATATAAGNYSGSNNALTWSIVADTIPPTAPTGLIFSNPTSTGFALTWTPSTDNIGVTNYTIYQNGVSVGTSPTNGWSMSGLAPATSYSITVVARDSAGNLSPASGVLVASTLDPAAPMPSTGMRLWLRADMGVTLATGGVATWLDQSGNHKDASQPVTTQRPQLVTSAVNGNPVIRFDGVDDWMEVLQFMSGATQGDLFVVAKLPNFSSREDGMWSLGGADGTNTEGAPKVLTEDFGRNYRTNGGVPIAPLDTYVIYNISATTGDWNVRLNGLTQTHLTDNIVQFGPNGWLGRAQGRYLKGDIAEVIAYDRVLSIAERGNVSGYLAGKYAVARPMEDPNGDADHDGLTNAQELYLYHTNPLSRDTDGDTLSDGDEVALGYNPNVADAPADADGDGVPNNEDARPTNPAIGRLTITIATPANGSVHQ